MQNKINEKIKSYLSEKEWWEDFQVVKNPKDFFGNIRKGTFVIIGNLEIPLELAKKYNSKKELMKDQLKEAQDSSKLKELKNDPLYKAVIDAKNEKEAQEALNKLISVRGKDAVNVLKKALKEYNG